MKHKTLSVVLAIAFPIVTLFALSSPIPASGATVETADRAARLDAEEAATQARQINTVEYMGQVGGAINSVAVQGDYAYVGEGPRLVVLNVSNPAHPTVVGKTAPLPQIVRGVTVVGSYAYVAAGYSGLWVFNISNPVNPTAVGSYDTAGYAYNVFVAGDYAYVADGSAGQP